MPGRSTTAPLYQVRDSGIHGRGVFAARDIRKGSKVIEYKGERITKEESERRGLELMRRAKNHGGAAVYIFNLDDEWDLDGDLPENDAKLINHSCQPNCEAWDIRGRIWIGALRSIRKGEELTFNYGFDVELWEDHPCRCGAPACVGYIVDRRSWPRLKRLLRERADLRVNGTRNARR